MIEALKSDQVVKQLGGRFKLTSLIQRRLVELLQGARPLVDTAGMTDIEVVVREIMEGKIGPKRIDWGENTIDGDEAEIVDDGE